MPQKINRSKILSITESEFMDIVKNIKYHLGNLMKKTFKKVENYTTKTVRMIV